MLQEFQANSFLRLVRNPNYWQPGLPYLDGVTFSFVPNSASLLVALRNGRADIGVLERPQDADQLSGAKNLTIVRALSLNHKALDLPPNFGPFSDIRVRQAVALAIDKKEIMDAAIGDKYGRVVGTILPAMQERWGVPLDELPFQETNLDKARQLLTEAGYPNGFDIKLRTIVGFEWMEPAAVTIVQELQARRTTSNRTPDLGVWVGNLRAKNMDLP